MRGVDVMLRASHPGLVVSAGTRHWRALGVVTSDGAHVALAEAFEASIASNNVYAHGRYSRARCTAQYTANIVRFEYLWVEAPHL